MGFHAYTAAGKARHTYIDSTGQEKPTGLKVMREEGLYPSVTSVIKILSNDMVEEWSRNKLIEYCASSPQELNETLAEFKDRVTENYLEDSRVAREFGTLTHKHLEEFNKVGYRNYRSDEDDSRIDSIMPEWEDYFNHNIVKVISPEQTLACPPVGLAGTIDLVFEHNTLGLCLLDYKTQNMRSGRANFYPNFSWQLALYARMYRINNFLDEDPRIISMVVNSAEETTGKRLFEKVYKPEDQQNA